MERFFTKEHIPRLKPRFLEFVSTVMKVITVNAQIAMSKLITCSCEDIDECLDYICPSYVDNSQGVNGFVTSSLWNPVSDDDGTHDCQGNSRCYCACSED